MCLSCRWVALLPAPAVGLVDALAPILPCGIDLRCHQPARAVAVRERKGNLIRRSVLSLKLVQNWHSHVLVLMPVHTSRSINLASAGSGSGRCKVVIFFLASNMQHRHSSLFASIRFFCLLLFFHSWSLFNTSANVLISSPFIFSLLPPAGQTLVSPSSWS